jgi:DtxR family Mn-dependent transcriptional regulator
MCRRLVDKGLLEYQPYRGVTLTAAAESLARRVLRNRRLWELFFVEKLGISPEEAEEIACRFEHVTPDGLAERLAAFLGHPRLSPQNEPIPYDHQLPLQEPPRPLALLPVGAAGQVAGVKAGEVARNFLRQCGLIPGKRIEILAIAADGGVLLEISGQPLSLSKTVADTIDVTLDNLN